MFFKIITCILKQNFKDITYSPEIHHQTLLNLKVYKESPYFLWVDSYCKVL